MAPSIYMDVKNPSGLSVTCVFAQDARAMPN